MESKRGRPSTSELNMVNLRDDVLYRCRYQYFQNDLPMHIFIKQYVLKLTIDEIRWLLDWSGDGNNWDVTAYKEIVERKG